MKLVSFTFHPHPIQVDGRPIHGVRVGDNGVTEITLADGVLTVARGMQVWFTHTSFGTGVPARDEVHDRLMAEAETFDRAKFNKSRSKKP